MVPFTAADATGYNDWVFVAAATCDPAWIDWGEAIWSRLDHVWAACPRRDRLVLLANSTVQGIVSLREILTLIPPEGPAQLWRAQRAGLEAAIGRRQAELTRALHRAIQDVDNSCRPAVLDRATVEERTERLAYRQQIYGILQAQDGLRQEARTLEERADRSGANLEYAAWCRAKAQRLRATVLDKDSPGDQPQSATLDSMDDSILGVFPVIAYMLVVAIGTGSICAVLYSIINRGCVDRLGSGLAGLGAGIVGAIGNICGAVGITCAVGYRIGAGVVGAISYISANFGSSGDIAIAIGGAVVIGCVGRLVCPPPG